MTALFDTRDPSTSPLATEFVPEAAPLVHLITLPVRDRGYPEYVSADQRLPPISEETWEPSIEQRAMLNAYGIHRENLQRQERCTHRLSQRAAAEDGE